MSDPTPSSSSATPDVGALSLSNGDAPAAAAPRKQARLAELPPMPPRSSRNKEDSDGSADERDEDEDEEISDVEELEGARIRELGSEEGAADGDDVADLLKEYPDDEEVSRLAEPERLSENVGMSAICANPWRERGCSRCALGCRARSSQAAVAA